ncbi:MAG TPA: hypothetical protein PKM36_13525, partial [Propionibacteriaceae bacterium]|nr:hypothetical protein [Propionibacteriaceae bacterium]
DGVAQLAHHLLCHSIEIPSSSVRPSPPFDPSVDLLLGLVPFPPLTADLVDRPVHPGFPQRVGRPDSDSRRPRARRQTAAMFLQMIGRASDS